MNQTEMYTSITYPLKRQMYAGCGLTSTGCLSPEDETTVMYEGDTQTYLVDNCISADKTLCRSSDEHETVPESSFPADSFLIPNSTPLLLFDFDPDTDPGILDIYYPDSLTSTGDRSTPIKYSLRYCKHDHSFGNIN
ncbi:MAG: hypothetical protein LBS54_01495 [Dysgonamonadaceae bacterium]|jgi:hypothetical protein|nr:hypothetical protein [Dysgonamonadaceae bacterium]